MAGKGTAVYSFYRVYTKSLQLESGIVLTRFVRLMVPISLNRGSLNEAKKTPKNSSISTPHFVMIFTDFAYSFAFVINMLQILKSVGGFPLTCFNAN